MPPPSGMAVESLSGLRLASISATGNPASARFDVSGFFME
jgi:hypothetical protein